MERRQRLAMVATAAVVVGAGTWQMCQSHPSQQDRLEQCVRTVDVATWRSAGDPISWCVRHG